MHGNGCIPRELPCIVPLITLKLGISAHSKEKKTIECGSHYNASFLTLHAKTESPVHVQPLNQTSDKDTKCQVCHTEYFWWFCFHGRGIQTNPLNYTKRTNQISLPPAGKFSQSLSKTLKTIDKTNIYTIWKCGLHCLNMPQKDAKPKSKHRWRVNIRQFSWSSVCMQKCPNTHSLH